MFNYQMFSIKIQQSTLCKINSNKMTTIMLGVLFKAPSFSRVEFTGLGESSSDGMISIRSHGDSAQGFDFSCWELQLFFVSGVSRAVVWEHSSAPMEYLYHWVQTSLALAGSTKSLYSKKKTFLAPSGIEFQCTTK